MKKLNILIPTYNRQELLLKNVKKISSFIKGNTQIVICDNSKLKIDNTFFSKNVSYFHNGQNLGFDGNVAECLDKSNSEYIWFFSDDDEMPEKTYNKVMKLIENSFPDRVLVDALVLDETNEIIIDSLSPTITNKKTIQIDNNTFHKFYEFSTLISSNVLKYSTINQSIINRFKGSCFTQLGLFWYDSIGLNLSIVNDFKIIKFDSKSNDFSK